MPHEEEGLILDVTPGDDEPFETDMLSRMGHPVLVCHGPGEGHGCPILHDDQCPLLDQAHGVVFQLDLDKPTHRSILQKYQQILPVETPIRAVVRPGQDDTYRDLLHGVQTWTEPPGAADLDGFAAQVEAADSMREEG